MKNIQQPTPNAQHPMGFRRSKHWLLVVGCCLCLFAALTMHLSAAETNAPAAAGVPAESFGVIKGGFSAPFFYDPPNQNQMKSLVESKEASWQTNGYFLLKELDLKTYGLDGKIEMTVHTPECFYNPADQSANSASHIEVSSGDGKMLVEGEGFLWHNADSTFAISNRVHTIIRQSPEKSLVP